MAAEPFNTGLVGLATEPDAQDLNNAWVLAPTDPGAAVTTGYRNGWTSTEDPAGELNDLLTVHVTVGGKEAGEEYWYNGVTWRLRTQAAGLTVVADIPTSFARGTVSTINANSTVTNGTWRANGTAPMGGAPAGNFTWTLEVTRIGDWVRQCYTACDTSWRSFWPRVRESYDAGGSWSSWSP